jgi:hypothetical protein
MFEMIFENKNGLQLNFGPGTPFTITEFSGLNPPKATINTNQSALVDGGTFNSSKLQMRSMNIAFAVEVDPAQNRLEIYKVVQSKMPLRVYYKSETLDVFVDGYVENVDFSYWAKKNICTVSVLCPFPYLKAAEEIINELSTTIPMFRFPFHSTATEKLVFGSIDLYNSQVVENKGSVETGLTFELYAKNAVTWPKVIDYETGQSFQINIVMQARDLVTVNTMQGSKSVKLLRNGVESNIFNLFDKNSTWLQLGMAGSTYFYEVASGNPSDLEVTIKHYDLFEGV